MASNKLKQRLKKAEHELEEWEERVPVNNMGKWAKSVAIKSKQEGDVAAGMLECLNKMKNTPKKIYTDDEGALKTEAMQKNFNEKIIVILLQEPTHTLRKYL